MECIKNPVLKSALISNTLRPELYSPEREATPTPEQWCVAWRGADVVKAKADAGDAVNSHLQALTASARIHPLAGSFYAGKSQN